MLLPPDFDPDADDAVDQLVASGFYDRPAAEDIVELLLSDDPEIILR